MAAFNQDKPNAERRRFIRGAGTSVLAVGGAGMLAAGGSFATETAVPRCKTPGCDYDVVVIGGGFAGVSAARDSRENGYHTLLLEARNRLGGRTFSSEFAGHKVELGGTWIHWSQPFVWAEKERYNLDVKETPGAVPERMILRMGNETRTLSKAEVYSVIEAFQAFTADARSILERPWDIHHSWDRVMEADKLSARDRLNSLDLTPLQRACMDSLITASAHNVAGEMSYVEALRWFSLAGFNDFLMFLDAVGRFSFKDGTISLINAMLEDGKPEVRLSTPVKQVEDLGDNVRITTNRGETITAGAVIVALPMNVLPDVTFNPPLDGKVIEAGRIGHTGQGVKVYAKAKGKLGKIFTMAESDHPISTIFTYYEGEDHTLLAGFGTDRNRIDYFDEEAVQAALRDYIPDIEIDSTFAYDWVLDPYSKGTYCSYKPGWMSKYYDSFQQDRGRIFFGQGDHGEGWRGFIDGAIGAGIKAAQRVSEKLGEGDIG